METAEIQVRRATLEDLPALRELWETARMPVHDLERRFTEFQVAVGADGMLAGAVGLHIQGQNCHLHSEAIRDEADVEAIRAALWHRVLTIAKNHGLMRLWTLASVSFYRQQGLAEVDDFMRARTPAGFGNPNAEWLTLKLKDEVHPQLTLEQEFQLYIGSQKGQGEQKVRQAQALRYFAYAFLAFVMMGLAGLAFYVFRRLPRTRR